MSELQTSLPALVEVPEGRATTRCHAPLRCKRAWWYRYRHDERSFWCAAHEEHWATIVCNSGDDALRQTVRQRVQLALVDLQSAPSAQVKALKQLVEQLAARRVLLAVCGKPDDLTGEVWSRQLGVWMYLPGVDSQSDIALLCGEARNVLEKLGSRAVQAGT